jgi:glucosamine-6-phosphate deaminase
MKIVIGRDRTTLGSFVAQQAAHVLREALAQKSAVNLVVATGSSQFEVLSSLIPLEGIDWSRVYGFHLDEYLGLPANHPASFCGYLRDRFVSRVPIAAFYYLDGTKPPEDLVRSANQALRLKDVDLMLCGIGENAHLAFNDPPADFELEDPYHVVQLDEACRRQQVGEGWFDSLDTVPKQAISMTVKQIMKAKQILCTVPDRRKAEAVKQSVEGAIDNRIPASILQAHPNVLLGLDQQSSFLLSQSTVEGCRKI